MNISRWSIPNDFRGKIIGVISQVFEKNPDFFQKNPDYAYALT